MAEEEKKIIIDEDWKHQAQKEKEILAAKEKVEAEKQPEAEKEIAEKQERGPFPPGDFAALLSMLVTQAFFALGLLHIEGQEQREPDLGMAKYNIDMLETLEEKTKGNLTDDEQKALKNMLSQLRMAYVKASE